MSFKIIKLGEVCNLQNGFAFKSKFFTEDGLPILRISNIQNQIINIKKIVYFRLEKYKEKLDKYIVEPTDLLIAMSGATTGKIGFNNTDQRFYLNQRVGNLKPKEILDKKYLYYFLSTQIEKNLKISLGAAQPNLSTEQILDILIPVPPLPIQQKIVDKLDLIFAEIDKVMVLAEENVKNAEALFKSYLKKESERMTILYGKKPIEYFCDDIFAGGDVPKDAFSKIITSEYSIPIIANAEKNNGLYGYTNKPRVIKPSLTIAGRGSGTGHTKIRTEPFFPIVRLIVLTPNANLIKLKFLNYSVLSLKIQSLGSAIPQLTIPMIKGYFIPNTPISEQDIFIKKIDNIFNETIKIKSIEKRKIEKFNFLKQSILKQAFKGELIKAA